MYFIHIRTYVVVCTVVPKVIGRGVYSRPVHGTVPLQSKSYIRSNRPPTLVEIKMHYVHSTYVVLVLVNGDT